jgi:hypothetical protein
MKAAILVLTFVAATPAFAMGKRPRVTEEPRVSREAVNAIEETADGVIFSVGADKRTPKQVGCFRLYYGSGLVACAKPCSDSENASGVVIAPGQEYSQAWTAVDRLRLENRLPHDFGQLDGFELLKIETRQVKRYPDGRVVEGKVVKTAFGVAGTPGVDDDAACRTSSRESGDECLSELARLLPSDRFLDQGLYEARLGSLAQQLSKNPATADLADPLLAVALDAGKLREALHKAGLDAFERSGHFYAVNARNAPGLLCELRSAGPAALATSERVRRALRENADELRKSIDFVSRLGTG